MKFIVCNLENKECMVQRCPECPHTDEPLVKHLKEIVMMIKQFSSVNGQQQTGPP